jgi:hypothetical protein
VTDAGRDAIRRLAERRLAGEQVWSELHAEALRRLDEDLDRVASDERRFLEEVRFSCPGVEEGPPRARGAAREQLAAAAEAFTGRVRTATARSTIRGASRPRRTTR